MTARAGSPLSRGSLTRFTPVLPLLSSTIRFCVLLERRLRYHHSTVLTLLTSQGFGGVASGHKPLKRLHDDIRRTLEGLSFSQALLMIDAAHIGRQLSVTGIVDLMNFIGRCVVAGN